MTSTWQRSERSGGGGDGARRALPGPGERAPSWPASLAPLPSSGRRAKAEAPRGVNVLLVEDDDGLREAVVHGLGKAGFSVSGAATGREALDLARERTPDAVVIDVLLPDSGGLGLATEMRQRPGLNAVPILFITALAPAVVRDTLYPAPVLYKPFTYRQLVASVRYLVQGR